MKLLHIGNRECMKRYTKESDFTKSVSVVDLPPELPVQSYLERAADAEVIIADAIAEIPGGLIRSMPRLRLIHSEGVAYNKIDLESADEKGVFVCNSAGMNARAVAEQTLLLMQGALRDVLRNDRAVREGRQIEVKSGYMADGSLRDLADCTVGLVGLGHIGQATAALLKAYGTRTLYTQRRRAPEQTERDLGVTWTGELDALLSACDIVSLHLPVTAETERMCGESFFSHMKPGSYFINTSRGELVDDAALIEALRTGRLAMAGLDTLDNEPVGREHILLNQPEEIAGRLIFSPHIGGITGSSFRISYRIIWENIRRVSVGETPKNIVNHPKI